MFSRSSNSSPAFPTFHCVGWIKSAHGIKGEIYIQLAATHADWLSAAKDLALLKDGATSLQVFALKAAKPHKDGLIARLEGIEDRNTSETWRKAKVYIREEILVAEEGEPIYLKQIENFTLADPEGRALGRIVAFSSNGAQDLLEVALLGGGEALVPFVDEYVVHIDFDNREVRMDLPAGLLTLEDE